MLIPKQEQMLLLKKEQNKIASRKYRMRQKQNSKKLKKKEQKLIKSHNKLLTKYKREKQQIKLLQHLLIDLFKNQKTPSTTHLA